MDSFRSQMLAIVPRLRAYARSLVKNSTIEADDLVHDVVAEMLSSRDGYDEGNFAAWAFTIQRRLFWKRVRKAMRLPERQDPSSIENDKAVPSSLVSIPNQDDTTLLREVERAIGLLPADQREVLHLVAMEGLSYREIAEIFEESEAAVKSRIHRARRAVERMLSSSLVSDNHRRIVDYRPDQPNGRRLGSLDRPGTGPNSDGTISSACAGLEAAAGTA